MKNNAVTDYVIGNADQRRKPNGEGDVQARVRSDTILIIVTTRDGGFTAQCSATFKGAPIRVTGVTLDDTLEF